MLSEFVQSSRLARLSIPLKKEIQLLIFPIHWDIISWIQPWGMIIYNLGNKMKENCSPLPFQVTGEQRDIYLFMDHQIVP